MVRTVSSGFDAQVERPGGMILQFRETLRQTQIGQYSPCEKHIEGLAFDILDGAHQSGGRTPGASGFLQHQGGSGQTEAEEAGVPVVLQALTRTQLIRD